MGKVPHHGAFWLGERDGRTAIVDYGSRLNITEVLGSG